MENTRKFLKRGLRKVIAIWGDGTINEVLRRFSLEMNAKMIMASLYNLLQITLLSKLKESSLLFKISKLENHNGSSP
jgi:hypothetical protein